MIVLMLYTIVSLITCIWMMRGSILANYWFFQVMLHIVFPGRCCIVSTCFFGKSQYVASNLPGDWLLCEPEKMFEEYSESAAASAWNARKAGPHLCDESYIHLHVGHFLGGNVGKCFTHESLK